MYAERNDDSKHVFLHAAWQVCELLTKNAWRQAKDLMKQASPTNKVGSAAVLAPHPAPMPLEVYIHGCYPAMLTSSHILMPYA
jgi:hypothetical protein